MILKTKTSRTAVSAFGITAEEQESENKAPLSRWKMFERHFDGYRTISIPSSDGGKPIVECVYTGKLFRQSLSSKDSTRLRILHCLLFAFAASLFVLSMFLNVASNRCWYVTIAYIIPGIFYVRLLFALATYIPAGLELKNHEYYDGARMLPAVSKLATVSLLAPMVAVITYILIKSAVFSSLELLRFALLVLSASAILLSGRLESRVAYTELNNQRQSEQEQK